MLAATPTSFDDPELKGRWPDGMRCDWCNRLFCGGSQCDTCGKREEQECGGDRVIYMVSLDVYRDGVEPEIGGTFGVVCEQCLDSYPGAVCMCK